MTSTKLNEKRVYSAPESVIIFVHPIVMVRTSTAGGGGHNGGGTGGDWDDDANPGSGGNGGGSKPHEFEEFSHWDEAIERSTSQF